MVDKILLAVEDAKPFFEDSVLPPVAYNLVVRTGECVVIETSRMGLSTAFADLCSGVVGLESGHVQFEGMDWTSLKEPRLSALRGRIGRIFQQGGWVDMYPVAINILMPMLHHTSIGIDQLTDLALTLCHVFGLPGLPMDIPRRMLPIDLQRAACIRALMGNPHLLLLEHPFDGFSGNLLFPLFEMLNLAQNRGAGVICFTRQFSLWNGYREKVTHWMRLEEKGLEPVKL